MARPGGQPGPGAPGQPPISFKTVPGRNRTQKWNQAKTYNYDGDDWGGFDPYDEYGGSEVSTSSGPYPQPGRPRQQSFEAGTERRQFSTPNPPYIQDRSHSPAKSTGSSGYSDGERRRREYSNPTQVPPPLNTRASPQPPDNRARQNSTGSDMDATSPGKAEKPLPFIRPSDIYKRMAEEKERERQSLDSSRPSIESLQREGTPSSGQRPLSTVQERPGSGEISTSMQSEPEMHPGFGGAAAPSSSSYNARPVLPPVDPVSDFGADVLRAASTSETNAAQPAPVSYTQSPVPQQTTPGFQDVVQNAFDRQDSTSSQGQSEFGRSNTTSTSAISPIMSRVPSAATAAPIQHERTTTIPTIAEEPSHSRNTSGDTVVSRPHQSLEAAVGPEPALTDNSYLRSVNAITPPTSTSPARTPALETTELKRLSDPMAAEISSEDAGRPRADTDYSLREADLARAVSTSHAPETLDVAEVEHAMQEQFIEQHSHEAPAIVAEQPSPGSIETLPPPPAQPSRFNSFQPHMPGEWISPAATPAAETAQPLLSSRPAAPSRLAQTTAIDEEEQPDFSPTASRNNQSGPIGGALTAVKDAGVALGAAMLSSAGMGHQTQDFASQEPARTVAQPEQNRRLVGNITSRYPLDRLASDAPTDAASVASNAPPTPPAKDSSYATKPAATSYFPPATQVQPQASHEFESDRLSKDIVQSLNQYSSNPTATLGQTQRDNEALRTAPPAAAAPASRPGFLDQRFSWESQYAPAAPQPAPIAVVGELPGDKDRQSYERPPDGKALHVVNAPHEDLFSPISKTESPVVQHTPQLPGPTQSLEVPSGEEIHRSELSPSPVSMDESTHIPSYYAGVTDANFDSAVTPEIGGPEVEETEPVEPVKSVEPSSATPPTGTQSQRQSGRIPPFREILAMKEAPERIKTYTDTRQNFAEMNTGLNGWMSDLLAKYPEHSNLVNSTGGFNTDGAQIDPGSMSRGHRHNPSLLKIKQFATSFPGDGPDTPPKDYSDNNRQQMEKMQAKGKEMMKSASAFGGKAQAGAMGLFAKGRNKLRGDKVE